MCDDNIKYVYVCFVILLFCVLAYSVCVMCSSFVLRFPLLVLHGYTGQQGSNIVNTFPPFILMVCAYERQTDRQTGWVTRVRGERENREQ